MLSDARAADQSAWLLFSEAEGAEDRIHGGIDRDSGVPEQDALCSGLEWRALIVVDNKVPVEPVVQIDGIVDLQGLWV